jgi:hypothetical protein
VIVTGPLYNTNGDLLASGGAELWSSPRLNVPVGYDEFGAAITSDPLVWSGTTSSGGHNAGSHCGDWNDPNTSGRAGDSLSDHSWVSAQDIGCDEQARLYCVSPPLSFQPDPNSPAPFMILGPSDSISFNDPEITWEAADGASSYDVVISSMSDCSIAVESASGLTTTSYQVTNPLNDGTYYTCVTAKNLAGNTTQASNKPMRFTVDTTPPSPFTILGPSGTITFNNPEITWSNSSGELYYSVVISSMSDCSIVVESASDYRSYYQVTSPLSDGTYYTCVTAYDRVGNSTDATNNGLIFTVDTALYHEIFATSYRMGITTSTAYPPPFPSFGNLQGADWICSFMAFNAGRLTTWDGMSTPWKAVLSDSNENAIDRVNVSGPLYNTNGDLLAGGGAELWSMGPRVPVSYDEFGAAITSDSLTWSGTTQVGTLGVDNCGDWNDPFSFGISGDSLSATQWISAQDISCSEQARLYCVSPPLH